MDYDEKTKVILERAAHNCPVHHTLSNEVEKISTLFILKIGLFFLK